MRKTKQRKSKFWVLLLTVAVIVFAYNTNFALNARSLFSKLGDKAESIPLLRVASNSDISVPLDNLYSSNAILVQLDNHSVLMQKDSKQTIYPASLTKIMTAIVAIEKLPDLQKKVDLPNSMFQKLYKADASMAGFKPDEKVRAIDLLYGVMLPSGAECCIGLADHIAGSEQKFVELMNQKAVVIGMSNTHFTNSTGLQDDNHYTTVKDLSLLLSYALQTPRFGYFHCFSLLYRTD